MHQFHPGNTANDAGAIFGSEFIEPGGESLAGEGWSDATEDKFVRIAEDIGDHWLAGRWIEILQMFHGPARVGFGVGVCGLFESG